MKKLKILLLGPPEIRWGEEPLKIPRRYPRALLFYLAGQSGMIGRQELFPVFWPDASESTARIRLRETLGKLKASLPNANIIINEPDLLGLNPDHTYVDLNEFETIFQQVHNTLVSVPPAEPLPQNVYLLLTKANSLWRGPSFLSGANLPSTLELDNWLSLTNQHTEYINWQIMERLSDHALSTGNLEKALDWALRALQNNEFSEKLHERVLNLFIQLERPNDAVAHFAHIQELYYREFEISPPANILNIYQLARTHIQTNAPRILRVWDIKPSLRVPFIGRQETLQQLREALLKGGVVFILGESGVGKTRLMQEFTTEVSPNTRLLISSCQPDKIPFQPLVEAFRNHILPDEWLNLPKVWASQILTIFPDLKIIRPELEYPPLSLPGQARAHLFEAVRQITIQLTDKNPQLICLDDAQWADNDTLDLISYIVGKSPLTSNAVLLLIAARIEEHNSHLESLIQSIRQSPQVNIIQLDRLSKEEITELTEYILGSSPSVQFIEQLTKETGGNTFFILESLHALVKQHPHPNTSLIGSLPLATSLSHTIKNRIILLTEMTHRTLEVAAVIGTRFNIEILKQSSQIKSEQLIQVLEELESSLLIQPVREGKGDIVYGFVHEKFREVLLKEIHPIRLQIIHENIAQAIEKHTGSLSTSQATTLAEHYEAAGKLVNAFENWIQAGKHARRLLAFTDATRAFIRAEELVRIGGNQLSDDQIYQLYNTWGEMAYELDDYKTLESTNTELLKTAQERNSFFLTGTAYNGLSAACISAHLPDQGVEYAKQALSYLEGTDHRFQRMSAYLLKGQHNFMLNQWALAEEAFQKTLELGNGVMEPVNIRLRGEAHSQMAILLNMSCWPIRANPHAQLALNDFNQVNHTYGKILTFISLVLSYYHLGDYKNALGESKRSLELAEYTQAHRMAGYCRTMCSMVEIAMGNIGQATYHAKQTIALGQQSSLPDILATGYRLMGDIYGALKSHQNALSYYQLSRAGSNDGFVSIDGLLRYGYELFQTGDIKNGQEYVDQVLVSTKKMGVFMTYLRAEISKAALYINQGEWDQAKTIAMSIKRETSERSLKVWYLTSISILGTCAFQEGNYKTAQQHFQEVALAAMEIPNPWIELRARAYLVKIKTHEGTDPEIHNLRIINLLNQIRGSIPPDSDQTIQEAFQHFSQCDQTIF